MRGSAVVAAERHAREGGRRQRPAPPRSRPLPLAYDGEGGRRGRHLALGRPQVPRGHVRLARAHRGAPKLAGRRVPRPTSSLRDRSERASATATLLNNPGFRPTSRSEGGPHGPRSSWSMVASSSTTRRSQCRRVRWPRSRPRQRGSAIVRTSGRHPYRRALGSRLSWPPGRRSGQALVAAPRLSTLASTRIATPRLRCS